MLKNSLISRIKFVFFLLIISLLFYNYPVVSAKTNQEIINDAVNFAKDLAEDDAHHGYNNDVNNHQGENGDYSCAGVIFGSYEHAGMTFATTGDKYTDEIYTTFPKAGFEDIIESLREGDVEKGNNLEKGDVLIVYNNPNNPTLFHSAICTGDKCSTLVEATASDAQRLTGDQTGSEIYEHAYYYYYWNHIYRLKGSVKTTSNDGEGGTTIDTTASFPTIENNNNFTCENIFYYKNSEGKKEEKLLKKLLDNIFFIIKISAPIIAIALSVIDYIKALAATDSLNKINQRMINRVIIALIIVMLPYILDLLFKVFGLYDLSRCDIG